MLTYLLQNGQKADIHGVIEAVQSTGEFPLYLFDTVMGNVCSVESKKILGKLVRKIGKKARYQPIAKFDNHGYTTLMGEFLERVLASNAPAKLTKSLKKKLQTSGWESVIQDLEAQESEEWLFAWKQFIENEASSFADYLLREMPGVSVSQKFDGCANCPICQAMREGDFEPF